jgi:uncharacterized membrane protein
MEDGQKARFWEVDLLRGMAIVLMIIYHFFFDLHFFKVYEVNPNTGILLATARTAVALFLLLVGFSLNLSHMRARLSGQDGLFFRHLLRRSATILSLALGITAVTYLFIGRCYIVFGVLHNIGLSLLLAYPFLRLKRWNFAIGLLLILLGLCLQNISVSNLYLFWLGLTPKYFCSLDYIPLFPWFGVVLLGIGLGGVLYPDYIRRVKLPDLSGKPFVKALTTLGRNSLAIYLIHQPILIGILYSYLNIFR